MNIPAAGAALGGSMSTVERGRAEKIVLRVRGLSKRYDTRAAVENLDLEVRSGEVFGFLGPNGAGKSTTIAMILGLVRSTAGRVEILGHDAFTDRRAALAEVGSLVETPAFYPYLSGLDNLRVLAWARGGVTEGRFGEVLSMVGLEGREQDKFRTYSLGMKQRLGIAAALLHEPELLILDEPTNGLDPAGMVEVRNLILKLARRGQTIVLSSHLLSEVQQVCDRALILSQGRVAAVGEVDVLLSQDARTVLRTDDTERAERVLRMVPWIRGIERRGEQLLLRMPEERAFSLGELMNRNGLVIGEMRRQERDLERYFLEITAGNAHETQVALSPVDARGGRANETATGQKNGGRSAR